MNTNHARHVGFAGVVLLLCGTPAWGCSCKGSPSEREAWRSAKAVFLGQVERADARTVSVRVDEGFKGSTHGQVFELVQSVLPCMVKLSAGEQVVIYLNSFPAKGKPGLWVAGCGRGVDAASVPDDLLFLRKLPGSAKGNRLSGIVWMREESRGVPGVTVRVSKEGRVITRAVTDAEGAYEFYGLAGGTYKVEIDTPEKLRIDLIATSGARRGTGDMINLGFYPEVTVRFWLKARE